MIVCQNRDVSQRHQLCDRDTTTHVLDNKRQRKITVTRMPAFSQGFLFPRSATMEAFYECYKVWPVS